MKLVICVLLLVLVGCGSSSFNIKPIDAKSHELFFQYTKGSKTYSAKGLGSSYQDESVTKVRVFIPYKGKGFLLVTKDGDEHDNIQVDDKKYIDISVPNYDLRKSQVLGFSLVTKEYGNQTGRLYLLGNLRVTDEQQVTYECPYKVDNGLVGVCQRPGDFHFYISVHINESLTGKMRVVTEGTCSVDKELYDIEQGEYLILVTNDELGYCSVRVDTRLDYNSETKTWGVEKAKQINVNYYDPNYIPLAKPTIEGKSKDWKIYPSEDFKSYYLNGTIKSKSALKKYKKRKYLPSKDLELLIVLWDSKGRVALVSTKSLEE